MSTYFNRDKDIEEYFARYNEEFLDKNRILEDVSSILSFISRMNFPPKSRAFKKADFFTLFVELHALLIKQRSNLDVSVARREIDNFYGLVDLASIGEGDSDSDAVRYYKAALQASNDRSSRILRGELVGNVLRKSI